MAGPGAKKSTFLLENSRFLALGYSVESFLDTEDPRERVGSGVCDEFLFI